MLVDQEEEVSGSFLVATIYRKFWFLKLNPNELLHKYIILCAGIIKLSLYINKSEIYPKIISPLVFTESEVFNQNAQLISLWNLIEVKKSILYLGLLWGS